MTTIHTIQDLIQLLRDQPEWADELRGILLSTELRDLPAAVRELAQAVATNTAQTNERLTDIENDVSTLKEDVGTLKEDVGTLKEDVGTLKEDVSTLKEDVGTLKEDVGTLKIQVNQLNGSDYERRAEAKALARALEDLDFTDAIVVKGPVTGVQRILSSAYARARNRASQEGNPLPALTGQENFLNCDIIIADMGDPDTQDRRSLPVAYALFEASITADSSDIQRARARADTLAATLRVPVTPAVVADTTPDPQVQEAADAGVMLFLIPDR